MCTCAYLHLRRDERLGDRDTPLIHRYFTSIDGSYWMDRRDRQRRRGSEGGRWPSPLRAKPPEPAAPPHPGGLGLPVPPLVPEEVTPP